MIGPLLRDHVWQLVAMACLLAASGFFSGSETALFSLSRAQVYRMRHASGRSGRRVAALLQCPGGILNTLLLANMVVNVVYAGISAAIVLDLRRRGGHAWELLLASAVPLVTLILVGEVTPKMLAFVLATRWARLAAPVIAGLKKVLAVPLWVLEKLLIRPLTVVLSPRPSGRPEITVQELNSLVQLSASRGMIGQDANAILQEIVQLTALRVADAMVPRVDMVAFDIARPAQELIELFRATQLRRIPVYEGGIDRIVGVVHAKRLLLNPQAPLASLVAKVPFVPEAAKLERVLLQLRAVRSQMAIVVDEYGGTAGLITLEDILKEIVGELPDVRRQQAGPPVQQLSERSYLLDGELAIHEWADTFAMDLSRGRISTIGGFVTSLLGRIPRAGDSVEYLNLRFTVESMRRRRIGQIRLELLEPTR